MRSSDHTTGSTNLFCFASHLLLGISLTIGEECYNTGNFTTNSNYAKNRNLLLSSLASNGTAVDGGYYTATIGQDPDKVDGLVLCRGDSSPESCASCVYYTIHNMMTNCPDQKEAISWGGMDFPCVVRYSNRSIIGKLELSPMEYGYNGNNITSNLTEFDQIWGNLMDRTLIMASSGTSKCKFATGEINLTHFKTLYALMQCTPDISKSDCEFCLRQNMGYLRSCCYGRQGGYVLRPSCTFRWELYPFYNATADSILPYPLVAPTISLPVPTNTTITEGAKSYSQPKGGIALGTVIIIVVSTNIFTMALVAFTCFCLWNRKRKQKRKDIDEINAVDCLQFDFSTIRDATNNFSFMLGQAGLVSVYKGILLNGKQIAVRRLPENSQGEQEFKNEVHLLARLQHRNLVRLLGFCFEGTKRLLIYEYMPKGSLERFIFDNGHDMVGQLNWETQYKIIRGIARGIRYLHEDSRLRIIHGGLKSCNILLDVDMTPKIADFGAAMLLEMDETQGNTFSSCKTEGYMTLGYMMDEHFSIKSDVFSFGVLVLEIISGQRISNFRNREGEDPLTYAWENWDEGSALSLIDPRLRSGSVREIMRCIHIGMLCVQEHMASRPTMESVVLMLNSTSISLPPPKQPGFYGNMATINSETTSADQSRTVQV